MKKNILVVDDSALMRRVICDIIDSESTFQAKDVCRDGLEAYEKLKTTTYDAVVLDVNMPGEITAGWNQSDYHYGKYFDDKGCGCDYPRHGAGGC